MSAPHPGQRPGSQVFGGPASGAAALDGAVLHSGAGAVKVPAVRPYFWVVKLLTTAMGEAVSDYLVNDVNKRSATCSRPPSTWGTSRRRSSSPR
jgi:hypothetical protein